MRTREIQWIVRSAPWAMMYRKGEYVRIEASMFSSITGVELSGTACDRLGAWLAAYQGKHHLADTPGLCLGVGWEGVETDVLPEHAEQIAGCIAMFITDPANHDPVDCGETFVTTGRGSLVTMRVRKWTKADAAGLLERVRAEVVVRYPALVFAPLDQFWA